MNLRHARNCEELRTKFEGREAIYVEQGALRVRVSNIEARGGFRIRAEAEEIPTPGLGVGRFHSPVPRGPRPLRWKIGAGYLTSFSAHAWEMGYGGWSLYFAPGIVQAVVGFAARIPDNADANEAYRELCRLLRDLTAHEPSQFVFTDVVEQGSGEFRKSDSPAIVVKVSSGWIACPFCQMHFMLSDARRWEGETHITCGQKIIIKVS